MRNPRRLLAIFLLTVIFSACSILGIHFKIHNPHRAGKYPKKTEAVALLGNQDSKFRTCFNVNWYSLHVDFGEKLSAKNPIKGEVVIWATAVHDFDTLQLDLAENMKLKSLHGIYFPEQNPKNGADEGELKYYRKRSAVFVIMNKRQQQGKRFGFNITYEGIPIEAQKPPWSGGFVRKEDNLKKPWWGVACETEGASIWWPCKDVVNDEPDSADVMLIVPKDLVGVSNGKLSGTSAFSPAQNAYSWHISYPINLYDITFYIGNFKLLHDVYVSPVTHDTLQLNHYVLEQNYDKAKTHFQQLKNYLAFYEKAFGPYPWYRDGFKLVESPYEGMEHQTAIAYGNGYKNSPSNGMDYIILHETAHEWWGNAVTAADLADGWIHEGFATYAEALYWESVKGHAAYVDYLLFYREFIINRRPIVGPSGMRYFNYKDGDIYMKGCWVLHSLRYAINDDSLFFDVIKSFCMENRLKEIRSDALEELVNRKTGKDFHWFFQQYLYNRFTPELEYCIVNGNLCCRWTKVTDDLHFPVQVTMTGAVPETVTIYPTSKDITITPMKAGNTMVFFNDSDFLFKPVGNKKLASEAKKKLQKS